MNRGTSATGDRGGGEAKETTSKFGYGIKARHDGRHCHDRHQDNCGLIDMKLPTVDERYYHVRLELGGLYEKGVVAIGSGVLSTGREPRARSRAS